VHKPDDPELYTALENWPARPVSFSQLSYEYFDAWDRNVKDGKMVIISYPDHSSLYLDTDLTKEDQNYIAAASRKSCRWPTMP
jgi:hypothetical protein